MHIFERWRAVAKNTNARRVCENLMRLDDLERTFILSLDGYGMLLKVMCGICIFFFDFMPDSQR